MRKHVDIRVEGGVQGVGFRWATRARAQAAGLKGSVRNEDDGSVVIEVEGPEADLEVFIAWCWHGPPSAQVDRVTVTSGPLQGFADFDIRL